MIPKCEIHPGDPRIVEELRAIGFKQSEAPTVAAVIWEHGVKCDQISIAR